MAQQYRHGGGLESAHGLGAREQGLRGSAKHALDNSLGSVEGDAAKIFGATGKGGSDCAQRPDARALSFVLIACSDREQGEPPDGQIVAQSLGVQGAEANVRHDRAANLHALPDEFNKVNRGANVASNVIPAQIWIWFSTARHLLLGPRLLAARGAALWLVLLPQAQFVVKCLKRQVRFGENVYVASFELADSALRDTRSLGNFGLRHTRIADSFEVLFWGHLPYSFTPIITCAQEYASRI
jgi:hypothetical protein